MGELKKKYKKVKKLWDEKLTKGWIGVIVYVLLGAGLAIGVNHTLGFFLNTPLPVVTVSSQSMVPTLNVGDITVVMGSKDYGIEDIIVFKGWKDDPIIHRVVGVAEKNSDITVQRSSRLMWSEEKLLEYSEDYFVQSSNPDRKIFITKGDNNARCDQCYGIPPVPESNVYGKAVIVIPYLGWVKILFVKFFIESPIYGIMFILISTVVYSIYKR